MATILVIDDNHAMRRLASRILASAGHTVHEAENGRQGLACLREVRPDLIVTDMIMPDVEGIETIQTIRRETPKTPILRSRGVAKSTCGWRPNLERMPPLRSRSLRRRCGNMSTIYWLARHVSWEPDGP